MRRRSQSQQLLTRAGIRSYFGAAGVRFRASHLSLCLLQKSFRILSTMEVRGRMLVLFFFLLSLSTTTMSQSTDPWRRKTPCQRCMSSLTDALYTSVSWHTHTHTHIKQHLHLKMAYILNTVFKMYNAHSISFLIKQVHFYAF